MRTILVADDIPMMRELAALFLARVGRVLTATQGLEAVEIARRERPDLIVVDLLMPELDGVEVCRTLKQDPELASIPVLVWVATDRAEDRERALRAGADDVLPKPIQRAELLETVNRFFQPPCPRGQPRIELDLPVKLRRPEGEWWGTARNLSRGGMFVECSQVPSPHSELTVELQLPGTPRPLASTAEVIWTRPPAPLRRPGAGLRFLSLDGPSARSLAEYVYERVPALELAGEGIGG